MRTTLSSPTRTMLAIAAALAIGFGTAAQAADTTPETPDIPAHIKPAKEKITAGDYAARSHRCR